MPVLRLGLSAFGGWIGDNGAVVALGVGGTLVAAALSSYGFLVRRRRGAACDPADARAVIAIGRLP